LDLVVKYNQLIPYRQYLLLDGELQIIVPDLFGVLKELGLIN
jgi:hypothetical protein